MGDVLHGGDGRVIEDTGVYAPSDTPGNTAYDKPLAAADWCIPCIQERQETK